MEQLNTNSRWSVSCHFFGENGYERGKILSVTGINLCHDNTEDTEIITQEAEILGTETRGDTFRK